MTQEKHTAVFSVPGSVRSVSSILLEYRRCFCRVSELKSSSEPPFSATPQFLQMGGRKIATLSELSEIEGRTAQ